MNHCLNLDQGSQRNHMKQLEEPLMNDKKPTPKSQDYPVIITEKLRYNDTDRQGHINNAVFATLCESGRCAFLYDPGNPLVSEEAQFVIAKLTINFMGEMNWPGDVVIGTGVERIGRTSFGLTQGLFADDQCVAICESVIVLMDVATRKSAALPADTIKKLEKLSVQIAP